jgi:hypothetical protein
LLYHSLQSVFFHDSIDFDTEVVFDTSKFKTTKEPLGTGTRIAFEVSFPSNDGNAFATALQRLFR